MSCERSEAPRSHASIGSGCGREHRECGIVSAFAVAKFPLDFCGSAVGPLAWTAVEQNAGLSSCLRWLWKQNFPAGLSCPSFLTESFGTDLKLSPGRFRVVRHWWSSAFLKGGEESHYRGSAEEPPKMQYPSDSGCSPVSALQKRRKASCTICVGTRCPQPLLSFHT